MICARIVWTEYTNTYIFETQVFVRWFIIHAGAMADPGFPGGANSKSKGASLLFGHIISKFT